MTTTLSESTEVQVNTNDAPIMVKIGEYEYPSYVQENGKPFLLNSKPMIITEIIPGTGDANHDYVRVYFPHSQTEHVVSSKQHVPMIAQICGMDTLQTREGKVIPPQAMTLLQREEGGIIHKFSDSLFLAKSRENGNQAHVCREITKDSEISGYEPVKLNGEVMILPYNASSPIDYSTIRLFESSVNYWDNKLIRWDDLISSFVTVQENGIIFDNVSTVSTSSTIWTQIDSAGRTVRVSPSGKGFLKIQGYFATPSPVRECMDIMYGKELVTICPNEKIPGDNGETFYAQYNHQDTHIGWISLISDQEVIPSPDANDQDRCLGNDPEPSQQVAPPQLGEIQDPIIRYPGISTLPDQIIGGSDGKKIIYCHNSRPDVNGGVCLHSAQEKHGLSVFCRVYEQHSGKDHIAFDNTSQYYFFRECSDGTFKGAFRDRYNISFIDESGRVEIKGPKNRSVAYIVTPREGAVSVLEPIGTCHGRDVLYAERKSDGAKVLIRIDDDFDIMEISENEMDREIDGVIYTYNGDAIVLGNDVYDIAMPTRATDGAKYKRIISINGKEYIRVHSPKGANSMEYSLYAVESKEVIPLPNGESKVSDMSFKKDCLHLVLSERDSCSLIFDGSVRWVKKGENSEDFKEFTDTEGNIIKIQEKFEKNIFLGFDSVAYSLDADGFLYPVEIPEGASQMNGFVQIKERRIKKRSYSTDSWDQDHLEVALSVGQKGLIERLSEVPEHSHLLVVRKINVNLHGSGIEMVTQVYDTKIQQCRVYDNALKPLQIRGEYVAKVHITTGNTRNSDILSLSIQQGALHRNDILLDKDDSHALLCYLPDGQKAIVEYYTSQTGGWAETPGNNTPYAATQNPETGRIDLFPTPENSQISIGRRNKTITLHIGELQYSNEAMIRTFHAQCTTKTEKVIEIQAGVQAEVGECLNQ